MSREWKPTDVIGIGNLSGDPDPLWGNLSGENAIKDATAAQQAALEKAFQAIQQYTGKAIEQQQPYTQFAGPDFQRMRGLVQSGYFQTPYGQSFQPQQFRPNGFTMNPGRGMASFQPQSFQRNSYTPQGLPPMPNLPAYQPPPQQMGGLMGGSQMPPLQDPKAATPPGGGGLMDRANYWIPKELDKINSGIMDYGRSFYKDPFSPKDPLGMAGDYAKEKILNAQIPSTGNAVADTIISALDPRNPVKLASAAGDVTKRQANKAVKYIRGLL